MVTGLLSLIQTTSSSGELYTWNHTMIFPPRHFSCLPLLSDYLWKFYRKTNWVLQKYFLQGELTTTELKVGRKLRENIDNQRRKDKNEGGGKLSWTFIYASSFNSLLPLAVNSTTWFGRCGNWGSEKVSDLPENTVVYLAAETIPSTRLCAFPVTK